MCAKRSHYNVWTYLYLTGLLQSKYFQKKLLKITVSASARWFPQIETDEGKDLKPLITQERLCTLILLLLGLKFYKNLDYNEIISVAFEMKARKKVGINKKTWIMHIFITLSNNTEPSMDHADIYAQ